MSGVFFSTRGDHVVAFRHLLRRALGRRVVRHGGGKNQHVHRISASDDRVAHIVGAADAHQLTHGRRLNRGRPGDERHVRAAAHRFGGDREAHPAARSVADVPHRIDVFVSRTGRHDTRFRAANPRAAAPPPAAATTRPARRAALPHPPARQVPLRRARRTARRARRRLEIPAHRPSGRTSACSSTAPRAPAPDVARCRGSTESRRRCRSRTWRGC